MPRTDKKERYIPGHEDRSHHKNRRRSRSRSPVEQHRGEGRDHSRRAPESRGQEQPRFPPPRDGRGQNSNDKAKPVVKEKPSLALSGKLLEDTNTYKGVLIKYSEPPEAAKPKKRYRLYPFKDDVPMKVLYVHRQSGYLIGRERKICDIPMDHPSISKQHAALQYRMIHFDRPNGKKGHIIKPYIIDLESANGTFLNGEQIEAKRYVELREKDSLKFGFSTREYVLLSEDAAPPEDASVSD